MKVDTVLILDIHILIQAKILLNKKKLIIH